MSKKTSIKQFLMRSGQFKKAYDCEKAIKEGKVSINDKIITKPNFFFNPKTSIVKVDGDKMKRLPKKYYLMNKPTGYTCQKSRDIKTIYTILEREEIEPSLANTLFSVGRLDENTEGLLIITNDGRLSNAIASPKNGIVKRYYSVLEKQIAPEKIKLLENGIAISIGKEQYKTKPCKVEIAGEKHAYISISEGRKRQIKKMFDAIGNKVVYLRRISIGNIQLESLKIGEFKEISRAEIYKKLNLLG